MGEALMKTTPSLVSCSGSSLPLIQHPQQGFISLAQSIGCVFKNAGIAIAPLACRRPLRSEALNPAELHFFSTEHRVCLFKKIAEYIDTRIFCPRMHTPNQVLKNRMN